MTTTYSATNNYELRLNGNGYSPSSEMLEYSSTPDPVEIECLEHYESNLGKYKDERDAIQKKTFTKWVNKHLKKAAKRVDDLFVDLQDGYNLIALLEVLSGETLPREKGFTRFHRIQNIQYCLDFLKSKKIKTVNIRPEDIVEGNPKLTLGLIWTIILHFQVSAPWQQRAAEAAAASSVSGKVSEVLAGADASSAKDALLQWAQRVTAGYPGVNVRNFTNSWRDGLAFNAILHRYRPNLIDWNKISDRNVSARERLEVAFAAAESEFGVTRLLDPEDVDVDNPDEKSVITYVSSLYDALPNLPDYGKYEQDVHDYETEAREWLNWVQRATNLMEDKTVPTNVVELRQLIAELDKFKADDMPPRLRQKQRLAELYSELESLFRNTDQLQIPDELSSDDLDRAWNALLRAMDQRYVLLDGRASTQGSLSDLLRRLQIGIGVTNEKLDGILNRIDNAEARIKTTKPAELERIVNQIVDDLNALEDPILGFFDDVEQLKAGRHPEATDYYRQVYGLHQRRTAYLDRLKAQLLVELGQRSELLIRSEQERRESIRISTFSRVEECIEWVRIRLEKLSEMEFVEDLEVSEEMFEQHKLDNRDIQDFRQEVDQCIARQAEVSAEDSGAYCELLATLESEYQQLRDLSAGRMLDLDSLIAFIRAAQVELVWINEREEIEVTRNWSDINQLDLPMLQNYYKQLLHEIELREDQFNSVHNQGAALLNQGHPAVHVIEVYLTTMQSQWDWLLSLAKCLEVHLSDALNLKSFMEEAQSCEEWMEKQFELLESHYNRSDFTLEEGEKYLRELDEIKDMLDKYHSLLMSLIERSRHISPLWQRGERITRPIPVVALCEYNDRNISLRRGDECTLLDNSDLIKWLVRGPDGSEGHVPSVVFRLPPPDERLSAYLQRLQALFDRLRKLWAKKHQLVRFNMVLNTMRTIRGWDLETFLAIDPDQREAIMKALNDDANKLLSEMDPNDPLAMRLREELRLTNEHFYNLLQQSLKGPEPGLSDIFDEKIAALLKKLEEAWKKLNDSVGQAVPRDAESLEKMIIAHKEFEDALQALDSEVSTVKELFRQLPDPSPLQRSRYDQLNGRWEDLWELSRMYVERLKALELVLNGLFEANDIVRKHEVTLNSFDDLPAGLERLRGVHSQLLEMNMVLQQQQSIIAELGINVGVLRQHVARTRFNVSDHPDVDRLEDEVQRITVRWENVCAQVVDRLKSAEIALQIQMIYRSEYENEIAWLDRVEATIKNLRKPEDLRPEEYQQQLDILIAEYSQLQERTEAIENVNREGGKYIREAKGYDNRLGQYAGTIVDIHGPGIRNEFRRTTPQPMNGAEQVTKELEELNRRFAQLSSFILERRNIIQVLMQNWKRTQQEDDERRRAEEEARRRAEEEARRRAEEEAERLRRAREEEEARRRAAEAEAERLRRLREEEDARRRAAEKVAADEAERERLRRLREAEEEAERLRRLREDEEARRRAEEEARRRAAEEDARRRAAEDARRKAEEEARRRAAEEEARRRAEEEARRRAEEEARRRAEEDRLRQKVQVDIKVGAPESVVRQVETHRSRVHIPPAGVGDTAHIHVPLQEPPKLNINQPHLLHSAFGEDELGQFEEAKDAHDVAKITEHEDEMNMYQEETVTNTQFYEMEAVLHKQTGEILTFVEAVRQGLLDLTSGAGDFYDIVSGTKISLEKAAELGYIDGSFNEALSTQYGIRHPDTKENITLLEAIQIGLYDPDIRQLRDPHTGEIMSMYDCVSRGIITMDVQHRLIKMGILKLPPMPLEQAIEQGVINIETGQFTGKYSKETMPLKDALYNGYIQIGSLQQSPMIAICLTDCIEKRFLNAHTGEFTDKNSNDTFTLRDAVSRQNNLLNLHVREVVNTADRVRLTLGDAVVRNAVNTRQGNFTDLQQRQSISLQEAYDKDLIQKPLTLTEIQRKDLIDSQGRFIDGGTKHRMTLVEAIANGLLDPEVRHIVDPEEKDVISIAEALERGVLECDGKLVDVNRQRTYSIVEAVREGLMVNRVRHSIFDVKGIKNTQTGANLSFNEAVNEGIIILQSERVVDLATQESFLLPDTAEKGLVDPMLHQLLSTPVGIKDRQGNELSVFRAVAQGIIDSSKAVFLDKRSNQELSPKDAYEAGQITLRGALKLTALFDIHPSLISAPKRVDHRRRFRRPGGPTPDLASDQVKVTLAEAMKQGLIDSRTQRFRQGEQEMSLQDALNQGLIDPASEWIVPSKSAGVGPTIEEKTSEAVTETAQQLAPKIYPDKHLEESVTTVKRLRTTETTAVGGPGGVSVYRAITGGKGSVEVPADGFHLLAAERQGLIDLSTGVVNPPNVDRSLTLEEAFDLGVINAKNIVVRDPKTGRQLSAHEAIEKGVMDKTGHITDARGQRLNLQSAIEQQLVSVEHEPPATVSGGAKKVIQFSSGSGPVMSFRPVGTATVEESEQSWTFDASSGQLVDQLTGERMSLDQAIATERMPTDQLLVRDTLTGREMSYDEAEKWGIIDKQRGYFTDKRDNRRYSMAEAAQQGRIYPTGGVPEHAHDAVHTSVKVQTKTQVTKKEALAAGPAAFVDYTLQKVVDLGWYNPDNGMFTHPDTNKQMTLKEAIIKGLFNPYDTVVIDRRQNKELSLLDAIQADIVDASAGLVTDTSTNKKLNLKEAAQQGILKSGMIPQTLETVVTSGRLDLSTGQFTTEEGRQVPLNEAISKNQLDGNSIVVRDPATGDELAFVEAVRKKIVDPSRGLVMNKKTGEAISFPQALTSGILAPVGSRSTKHAIQPPQIQASRLTEQKLQLTPYSQQSSQQQVSLREQKPIGAGRKELVDLGGGKQVMVKVVRNEDGLEKGEYVDPTSGMKFTIQLHGDPYVTQTKTMVKSTAQVQSVELEPHAEFVGIDKVRDMRTGRVMSLKDAQRAGLAKVDKKGKQMTKTYAVFRSDIYHAISEGVVDPSTAEKISLEDAIRAKIIDIRALTYLQPSTGEAQPFTQAANMGLMDVTLSEILPKGVCNPASGERIPITRAIELGIINPKTGEVFNPFTKEKLAWLDIVKPVYASLTMEGVYDPTKGYGVPVTSALNDGLIDPRTEQYCNPITGEKVSLADASAKGLIDEETYKAIVKPCLVDYRTQKSLNLLQAVDAKLIDPRNRTFRLGDSVVVPIGRAVQEGKMPSEVGERLKRVDKWTFAEALGKGLIDVKSNQFTDHDSGRRMTIAQALEQGFIDTGSVEAMEGSEERNLTNVLESDEFDENSGRIRERKTGLYLTFKQAIDKDVIDGDSLLHDVEAGQTMTIREAVNRGRVDNNGKYVDMQTNAKVNLKDAVKSGLVALIASPMQAAQSVAEAVKRRDTEGYRFKIDSSGGAPDGSRRMRSEETTTIKLSPHRVEPTLSLRVRTDENRDRIRSLIDDPQAIADRQYEFLDSLEKQQFDTNEKLIQNPATGRPVSVREAAESGLLDVLTGEIVHPTSGRRYSIPRAVHMRMVDPDPAKRVMESLNLSLEELNSTIQTLSPTGSTLSPIGGADSGGRSYTKVETVQRECASRESDIDEVMMALIELERMGANADPVDDPTTLQAGRTLFENLRDRLRALQPNVSACLRAADDVCLNGADILSPEEFHSLRKHRDQLKDTNDSLHKHTDVASDRLRVASDLLDQFDAQTSGFQLWMNDTNRDISELQAASGDHRRLRECQAKAQLDMEIAAAASQPTSSDPADIQRQLDAIRALNARMVEERRRLDDARAAGQQFLTAVEGTDGHGRQADELNNEWSSMEERYLLVTESLQNHANALQALHTQSQGVRKGLDDMLEWLGATEDELSTAKPLPLDKEKLAEQSKEQQLLQSNIESRRPALDHLRASINQLIVSSPSAANAGLTEKLADADKRFKLVARRCGVWGDSVQDAQKQLDAFQDDAAKFDQSLAAFAADLQNTNPLVDDINAYGDRLSALEPSHRSLIIAGENLTNLPNATDVAGVRDLIRNAENRWADTHAALEKRQKESEQRRKQLGEYETQRDRVLGWLKDAEQRLEELPPAPLLIPLVEEQRDIVQVMVKEHADFKNDMDLLNRLGIALIAEQQRSDTSTPNGKNKRLSSAAGLSPGSTISSGFSSYDANMSGAGGEEMSGVQREMFDANHRYDLIGVRLRDRTGELASVLQRLTDYEVARRDLERWTAERRKAVADLPLPLGRDDATRLLAELDRLNLQTKKERSRFDDARAQAHELTRLKDPELVTGLTQLKAGQEELEAQWDALQEDIRRENQRLLDAKDMHGNYDHLDKWLGSKQKMMMVLGPVSSDPKMLNNQLQQLEVLKDETDSQKPNWIQINDVAQDLVAHAPGDAAETRQLVDHIDALNRRWTDLQQQIEDREESLLKARGAGSEFAQLEREFRSKMAPISALIEQFAAAAPTQQEMDAHMAGLEELRAQMEEREGDIAGLQMSVERLQEASGDDPSVKTEILERFHALQQPFDEMKKKLDSLQRAAQNAKAEGKQFERQFDDLLEWMEGAKSRFDQMEPVSANAAKLRQQSIDFDPLYQEILEHEGEASLIKAKVKDVLKKSDNPTLREKLSALEVRWPPLLSATKDRRSQLEKASDIANQWADTKEALAAKLEADRQRMRELEDAGDDSDLSPDAIADRLTALRQLHSDVDKRQPEVDAAVTFAGRLQKAAPGADADNAVADADALANDWRGLETDVKRLVDETALNSRLWDTFNNTLHETEAALGRCDADADVAEESGEIGAVSKDRLRVVLAELDGPVNRKLAALRGAADDLKHTNKTLPKAVDDAVANLGEHASSLRQRLRDRIASLDSAEEVVNDARKRSSSLQNELKKMRSELSGLSPIARDSDHLKSQELEVDDLLHAVDEKQGDLDKLREEWDAIAAAGRATPGEVAAAKQQLDNLQAEIDLLRAELFGRKKEIGSSRENLDDLSLGLEEAHGAVMNALASPVLQQPVSSDLAEVRGQLDALQSFKDGLQPLAKRVDELLSQGHDLIKSAGPGVDTSQLDSELNKLGDAWNELKSRVTDRERKLDTALLGLGNYNDASKALLNWLEETEEMVANQKPPSPDNKVVKAQLQGYDVILKHIDEKQSSVDGFVAMVDKVESLADGDAERNNLRDRADDIVRRYDDLVRVAHDRRNCLQETLELAEQWSESLRPIVAWLDVTERKLQDLGNVPTDEDKLRAQIENQRALQEEIDAQRPSFDDLVEICPRLAGLVSSEDADDLESTLRTVVNRYDRLGSNAQACGILLEEMAAGISTFLANTDALGGWIDDAEQRIGQFDPIAVYPDALQEQSAGLMALAEDVAEQQAHVTGIVEEGRELCKHTSGDEAIALQGRLDNLRQRYADLSKRTDQKLGIMEEALPLAQQYHDGHQAVVEWLDAIEADLEQCDQVPLEAQAQLIKNMEEDLSKWRPDVDQLNAIGARLVQLSPGEGAEMLEAESTQMNRRFDAVSDQVQRRSERIDLALKNSHAMLGDLDDLIDWFHQAEDRMVAAGAAAAHPDAIKQQLKNQRLLNDDIVSQKSRVRDLLSGAKKLVRDFNNAGDDAEIVQHKIDTAREMSETVAQLSQDRLSVLEQALPLAQDFTESFVDLNEWLTGLEVELENCPAVIPGHHPEGLMKQQVHNNELLNAVQTQKPLIDKFEKTAVALASLCGDEDAGQIQESAESIAGRYGALRENIRARGIALDDAVQESSQFSDKLDMMLANLEGAAGQVRNPEPIAAHPDRIRSQIADNCALIDELEQKAGALQAVKESAAEIVAQARPDDPAIGEITSKISLLDNLWDEIRMGTELRGRELEGTLGVAQQFWDELESCKDALKNLKKRIETAEPAACEPQTIQQQQFDLSEIEAELREAAPLVDSLKATGIELCQLIGAQERPEVEQQIGELDHAWETVTGLYHKRHADLIQAMEKSMNFHEMLEGLVGWLEGAEGRLAGLPPVSTIGLDEIRAELDLVDALKKEIDDRAVDKEQLNQACAELSESATHEQAAAVRRPIAELNARCNKLYGTLNERQHKLERALLDLGQFQQAYDQLMSWIGKTEHTLDEIVPAPGDLRQTEIELAKHRVLQNDVHSHQASVDTLNAAGKRMISADPDGADATQPKLDTLNDRWLDLHNKMDAKLAELEAAKNEAESFGGKVEDWMGWVDDVDAALSSSKPTGGLPETAREQLDDFSILEAEIAERRPEIEALLEAAEEHLAQSPDNASSAVAQRLKSLKQKYDQMLTKTGDRRKKLEIALRDAEQFHELMTAFSEWLAHAEQHLNSLPHVSRLLEPIAGQMESHRAFQDEVQEQREVMSDLNSKGTKLQYYCEKKDAIPIKNLLVSAKHRFDKIVSRTADRTKQLDNGYHETKEFFETWRELCGWLDESGEWLHEQTEQAASPERIKELLDKHKDMQRELGSRQPHYDEANRRGRSLKDHAPQHEQPVIQDMLDILRDKWTSLCNGAVDRQRNLEEALLLSGQFKEAVAALMDWLDTSALPSLQDEERVHGDLDTVNRLIDQHKAFQTELKGRAANVATVRKAAQELLASGDNEGTADIRAQMADLDEKWSNLNDLTEQRGVRLDDALKDAEKLHKSAHTLLEWLSDMESKLKFAGALPDNEAELEQHLARLEVLNQELNHQRPMLDEALGLARDIQSKCHPLAEQPIKHWLRILQARWDEVAAWSEQRGDRLKEQLKTVTDQDALIDDLLKWIHEKENQLHTAEETPIIEDLDEIELLIIDHEEFEAELRGRQSDVDEATKGRKRADVNENGSATDGKAGKGGKKAAPQRKMAVKHPKSQQLTERWKQVWLESMERGRKLQDLLAYVRELRRLENFTFDEWKQRYNDWTDGNKSRVSDFFRRIDKSGTGKVPREDFINGILASKFPTTRLEMTKVADIFDKGDGLIDSKEFMAALRSDGRPKTPQKPKTDVEKINNEVQRQVQLCSCHNKYQIQQVGEGQYRFGDNQIKRMVRILRSTVMVRVGGGWEALDEFLVKHDPCRAKGKTNLELRDKYILPAGALDKMAAFDKVRKSPRTPTAASSGSPSTSSVGTPRFTSTPGPITKVREKTERSIPMYQKGVVRNGGGGASAGTSSSFLSPADSEVSSITSRRSSDVTMHDHRGRGGGSKPGSRPSSRAELLERPSSRCSEASDVSQSAERPTRIPSLRGRKGVAFKPSPRASPLPGGK